MDLQFAAASIGIRINREELSKLYAGNSIGLNVSMPCSHMFRVKLGQTNLSGWQFDSDPTGLWLSVPRAQLALLVDNPTAHKSIEHQFATQGEMLTIVLRVESGV